MTENLTHEPALTDREFNIGTVRFKIDKMPATQGWRLMEYIRHAIGTQDHMAGVSPNDPGSTLVMGIAAIAALPTDTVEYIRNVMFPHVHYWTAEVRGGNGVTLTTDGDIDMAFADLEPVHLYELIVRCLAVNFTASYTAILSAFPSVEGVLTELIPSTSPHS